MKAYLNNRLLKCVRREIKDRQNLTYSSKEFCIIVFLLMVGRKELSRTLKF